MSIRRIGILCLPGRGHLYPATALGRRLKDRGYEVTVFNRNIARSIVAAAGLDFFSLDDQSLRDFPQPWPEAERENGPNTLNVIYAHALLTLCHARDALLQKGVEALIVDQDDLSGGSIADALGIPFVTIAFSASFSLDDDCPPLISKWKPAPGTWARRRNRRGNHLLQEMVQPIIKVINDARVQWNLPPLLGLNDAWSREAVISQIPAVLDFPSNDSKTKLIRAGPFVDEKGRSNVPFPWHRLNGKPLFYVSMGTVRNGSPHIFEIIATACAAFDAQIVISLGGMALTPEDFNDLPGDPVVVHFAPQPRLLPMASLTIFHGGMNTALESLVNGVPLIAIPITDDQPGVAARIEWRNVGIALPFRRLSVPRLKACIQTVIEDPKYRIAAAALKEEILKFDGLDQAADIAEEVFSRASTRTC